MPTLFHTFPVGTPLLEVRKGGCLDLLYQWEFDGLIDESVGKLICYTYSGTITICHFTFNTQDGKIRERVNGYEEQIGNMENILRLQLERWAAVLT